MIVSPGCQKGTSSSHSCIRTFDCKTWEKTIVLKKRLHSHHKRVYDLYLYFSLNLQFIFDTFSSLLGSHSRGTKGPAHKIFLKKGPNLLAFPPENCLEFYICCLFCQTSYREWCLIICNCSRLILLQIIIAEILFLAVERLWKPPYKHRKNAKVSLHHNITI